MSSTERAPEASSAPDDSGLRKGERTRRRILEAARSVFADVGYERATIRGIAAAADVDKSSVTQHFGTKQQLFRDSVSWTVPVAEVVAEDPTKAAENLARGMFDAWAANPNSPMAVLLRTSMTSDDAAELLRTHITDDAIPDLAEAINAPNARLRAALFGAMLMGITSQRYLLQMPDLAAADIDDILAIIGPLLDQLFDPDRQAER